MTRLIPNVSEEWLSNVRRLWKNSRRDSFKSRIDGGNISEGSRESQEEVKLIKLKSRGGRSVTPEQDQETAE